MLTALLSKELLIPLGIFLWECWLGKTKKVKSNSTGELVYQIYPIVKEFLVKKISK